MGNWLYLNHPVLSPLIPKNNTNGCLPLTTSINNVPEKQEAIQQQDLQYRVRVLTVQSGVSITSKEDGQIQNQCIQNVPKDSIILPKILSINQNTQSQKPELLQSQGQQVYECDFMTVYNQMIAKQGGGAQVRQVLLERNKKIAIFWLKDNPQSEKQHQRTSLLQKQGYSVHSFSSLASLLQFSQSQHSIYQSVIAVYSFSAKHNSDFIIQQLYSHFVQHKNSSYILVVKPPSSKQYQLKQPNIDASYRVKQVSYPSELIIKKVGQLLLEYEPKSCFWVQLSYWPHRQELPNMLNLSSLQDRYRRKGKILLKTALRIGQLIIKSLQLIQLFKQLLYQYIVFHNLYFQGTHYQVKESYGNEKQIKLWYLYAVQKPIQVFLEEQSHRMLLGRVLKYNLDKPTHLCNIVLPLALLDQKIRQQHNILSKKSIYQLEFTCYWKCLMTEEELDKMREGAVYENLSFIRALTHHQSQSQYPDPIFNVFMVIKVPRRARLQSHEPGYCLLQARGQDKRKQFRGYEYVLFNLFNTFIITKHSKDQFLHTINLQYGYIPQQLALRDQQNYIPEKQQLLRKRKAEDADLENIIRYQSNYKILQKINDWGDALALVGSYQKSNNYYDILLQHHRGQISQHNSIKTLIQIKRIYNYQQLDQLDMAVRCCFNVITLLTEKSSQTSIEGIRQLQCIYLTTGRLLLRQSQYQKMASFGENLLRNKYKREEKGNIHRYSPQFIMQLGQLLAQAYISLSTHRFVPNKQEPRISAHFQTAMEMIEQIGEYHQLVPKFYLSYARWKLISRQPLEAVVYLNKAILILTTIHTQEHPCLCEYHQWAAVAYLGLQNHQQACNHISKAIYICKKYFGPDHFGLISLMELGGKCYGRMTIVEKAKQMVREEIRLLGILRLDNKKKIFYQSQPVGLHNRYQLLQNNAPFDSYYRQNMQDICPAYCFLHLAQLQSYTYQYEKELNTLLQTQKLIENQMHRQHPLLVQIHLKIAQTHFKMLNFNAAKASLQNMWRLISTHRVQQQYPSIGYHIQLAIIHQYTQSLPAAYESRIKAREIAFCLRESDPFRLHSISDEMVLLMVKMNKIKEGKRLADQTKASRKRLLESLNNQRDKVKLFGADFDEYHAQLRLGLCRSIEIEGILQMQGGNQKAGELILKQSLEDLLGEVGEYHPDTARIYKRLGKIALSRSDISLAHQMLHSAKSIYENNRFKYGEELVQIYLIIAKLEQMKNELVQATKQLILALHLLHQTHKFDKNYLLLLKEVSIIVTTVLEHKNENNLKAIYFVLSEHLEQHQISPHNNNYFPTNLISQIRSFNQLLLQLLDQLREVIMNINQIQGISLSQKPSIDKRSGSKVLRLKSEK